MALIYHARLFSEVLSSDLQDSLQKLLYKK